MFTNEQMKQLELITLEARELGLKHLDVNDPLDCLAAFEYARGWAKWEKNHERVAQLDDLSRRMMAILDEVTAPHARH